MSSYHSHLHLYFIFLHHLYFNACYTTNIFACLTFFFFFIFFILQGISSTEQFLINTDIFNSHARNSHLNNNNNDDDNDSDMININGNNNNNSHNKIGRASCRERVSSPV